jgi:ABC-type phosphate transport system substrate-binding protein
MRKLYASLFLTSALFMQTAAAQKNKVITIEGSSTLTPVFQEIASGFGRANKVGISVGSTGSA